MVGRRARPPRSTPRPSLLPPAQPSGVNANSANAAVSVSWSSDPGATSYEVFDATSPSGENYGDPAACTANPPTLTCTVSGLTDGTGYYFTVEAVNGGGPSMPSLEVHATPEPPPPAQPSGVGASAANAAVSVSWSSDSGATSYQVFDATGPGGENYSSPAACTANAPTLTCTVSGLTNGTQYYFTVVALNGGGSSSASSEVHATPEPPAPGTPSGVGASPANASASISWSSDSGATSYKVFDAISPGGENDGGATACTATAPTDTCTVSGLTNGTEYYFIVEATNGGGSSGPSSEVHAMPEPLPPSQPSGVSASAGNGSASVSWSSDSGATAYKVFEATSPGGRLQRCHGLHGQRADRHLHGERAHQRDRVLLHRRGHERRRVLGPVLRGPHHPRASGPGGTERVQRLGRQWLGQRQLVERFGRHGLQGLRRHQPRRRELRRGCGLHGQRADRHLHGERAHQRDRVLLHRRGHERRRVLGPVLRGPHHPRASGPGDTERGERLGRQWLGERQLVKRFGSHGLQGLRGHQPRGRELRRGCGLHGQRADRHLHGERAHERDRVLLHCGSRERWRIVRSVLRGPCHTRGPDSASAAAFFASTAARLLAGGIRRRNLHLWLRTFHGSTGSLQLQRPVVGIVPTQSRSGYWLDASDGGIFAFGDAGFYGSIPGLGLHPSGSGLPNSLNAPIVGMVPSADGGGYFMVASDGGVFAFGDARFAGSCPGIGGCSGAAVAVMPDASGNGYWVVTATGQVYTFGDAPYYGAPGQQSAPVTSAVRTPDGRGYWILFADGAISNYGDASNFGSPAGLLGGLDPATAIFTTSDGGGYWVASANGAVDNYGDAPNDGSMLGTQLNGSIIAATGW